MHITQVETYYASYMHVTLSFMHITSSYIEITTTKQDIFEQVMLYQYN